jgi:hypothetical protein
MINGTFCLIFFLKPKRVATDAFTVHYKWHPCNPMRPLFTFLFLVLIAASVLTWLTAPDQQTDDPIIYWMTDMHPGREAQMNTFQEWIDKYDHPPMELRLDAANNDLSKKLIQGFPVWPGRSSIATVGSRTCSTYTRRGFSRT